MVSGRSIELKALGQRLGVEGVKVLPAVAEAVLDAKPALPDLIVCDLASDGALDLIEQVWNTTEPQPVLVTLGSPRGDLSEAQAALLERARQRFRRPIDIQGVAEAILGMLRQPRPSTRVPQTGAELAFAPLKGRSSRAPKLSAPPMIELAPSSHPSSGPAALVEDPVGAQSRHLGSPALEHSVVSPELETLLAEAERRVQAQISIQNEPAGSTPPNGNSRHLSDDFWDALAEPLDEDEDNPLQDGSNEDGPPPSPLADHPAGRSLSPPGDSTVPPDLWEGSIDEDTGSHAPAPESEQTSGSMSPVTAAGNSAAPPTLGPGGLRNVASSLDTNPGQRRDVDRRPTPAPDPPSTAPPGVARQAETRPPIWPSALVRSLRQAATADSEPGSSDRAPGTLRPPDGLAAAPAESELSPGSRQIELPGALVRGAPALVIGRAVRQRFTGCLAFEVDQGLRRVVFKEGDVVIAASAVHGESLVSFLAQRGDLAQDTAAQIEHRIPIFGRHAGAALIARGLLEQGELWPVLRSHAEWVLAQLLLIERGSVQMEYPVPERLAAEPAVFGGATGAEVVVEVIQRTVPPTQAVGYLGNESISLAPGGARSLLAECALSARLTALVERAQEVNLSELLAEADDEPMLPCVLYALCVLDVLKVYEPPSPRAARAARLGPVKAPDHIDDEALRAKVGARRALVDEGDYFALLGVPRQATGYDIRRSYVELRRQFDPAQVLRPNTLDLRDDVDTILEVLDEAYEILRDQQRRERYRRAIESTP